ncbi:MAG: DNA polymerase III subunit beta [Ruminococcaceae bacterium]|nr:DNA polymerase III subunit beta [Oscillospiraceae bacterium]
MKVTFDRDILMQAVSSAMGTVSNKSTIASIEGILINTEGGNCIMSSYDLEKGIEMKVEAEVIKEGSYIINAQKLNQIVRAMPKGDITIEVDSRNITKISAGRSEFELHALNGSDFPKLPDFSGDISFYIAQNVLRRIIQQVSFAIAQNDSRPALNGAFFKIENNKLTVVSCDANRLALCEKESDITAETENLSESFIVPGKTLSELMKILDDSDEKVRINLTRKHIIFAFENSLFFSRLIDSEYIDYNRFIPKSNKVEVKLSCSEFIGSLERASLVTEDRSVGQTKSPVKLNFTDGILNVSSVSVTGKVSDEIAIEKEGDDIEIGFNCRYLLDALRSCEEEDIKVYMSTPLMSMIIGPAKEKEGESFTFLVLPVKM